MEFPSFFLFVLSTIVAVTAAHPSPTAVEDTSSVENAVKYIADELEKFKADLNPAILMEFLADTTWKSKFQQNDDSLETDANIETSTLCKNPNAGNLILSNTYIQEVRESFQHDSPARYFAFTRDLNSSDGTFNVKYNDTNKNGLFVSASNSISPEIWVSWPCDDPEYVNELLDKYLKMDKPKIYFARLFTSNLIQSLNRNENVIKSNIVTISCLAQLKRCGFGIKTWNWKDFQLEGDIQTPDVCNNPVDKEITKKNTEIEWFIHLLAETSEINNLDTFCPVDKCMHSE